MESDDSDSDSSVPKTRSQGFQVPCFELSSWNPQGCVGLQFMSIVPFVQQSLHAGPSQESHTGKMKVSTAHRKQRLKEFKSGRTTCRNIVDERRLRIACNENDRITVIELLDGGADASCEDDKKRTPLHIAASQGYQEIVSILLDRGADPNKKDFIGNTPLHLAACTCQIPVVTLLLKAGTDVKSQDMYGRTPVKLARSRLQKIVEEQRTCDSIRVEIKQISEMMSTYLKLSGQYDDAEELDSICRQLEKTTTREEVDHISSLMTDFASLNIQKNTK